MNPAAVTEQAPLLAVHDLAVDFHTPDGVVEAVRGISYTLRRGEILGLVGESGSGKSQSVLALLGLLPRNARVGGSARLDGRELLTLSERELLTVRGDTASMIFQDPMTSLNPYLTVGEQMSLVLRFHRGITGADALSRCEAMLERVHISEPRRRLSMYPHELSGGMRQRVMIASALLCEPALLIADEPTTALDVTVQAQILALLAELRDEFGTAVILITHDLGIVAGSCDRVLVMQRGELRESGETGALFAAPRDDYTRALLAAPRDDYTRALLAAVPRLGEAAARAAAPAGATQVLCAEGVSVEYAVRPARPFAPTRRLRAVERVSLEVLTGRTLGVVGESGCGKSTLARAVLRLVPVSAGRVSLLGRDIARATGAALKAARRDMQVVFQDPLASLNPRMTVREIVAEPLLTFEPQLTRAQREARVVASFERVGLDTAQLNRYPHEFSGGQCQRIAIARALVQRPRLLICDEAVSALDVTVQRQVVELLSAVQAEDGLSIVFIAHDLAVVGQLSHEVLVMYLGRAVEVADPVSLYRRPLHPYTRALIAAVPIPDPAVARGRRAPPLAGEIPSPLDPPSGCAFRTRCPLAQPRCAAEVPALREVSGALVACHYAGEIEKPA